MIHTAGSTAVPPWNTATHSYCMLPVCTAVVPLCAYLWYAGIHFRGTVVPSYLVYSTSVQTEHRFPAVRCTGTSARCIRTSCTTVHRYDKYFVFLSSYICTWCSFHSFSSSARNSKHARQKAKQPSTAGWIGTRCCTRIIAGGQQPRHTRTILLAQPGTAAVVLSPVNSRVRVG